MLHDHAAERMMSPDPVEVPPSSPSVAHLAKLQQLIESHRLHRAIMIFLFFFSLIISFADFDSVRAALVTHSLMSVLSFGGIYCIVKVYQVEAVFHGSSPFQAGDGNEFLEPSPPNAVSLMSAPGCWKMILETLIWWLHVPPLIPVQPLAPFLNACVILRAYVLLLYPSEHYSARLFPRVVNAVLGTPPAFRCNFFRSLKWWVWLPILLALLFSLAGFYAVTEDQPILLSWFFCISTANFTGRSSPETTAGAFTSVGMWGVGVIVIVWAVQQWMNFLSTSQSEDQLNAFLQLHRLSSSLPEEAANSIQAAWRFYVAKKEKRSQIVIESLRILVSRQCQVSRRVQYQRRQLKCELAKSSGDVGVGTARLRAAPHVSVNSCDSIDKRLASIEESLDHLIQQLRTVTTSG